MLDRRHFLHDAAALSLFGLAARPAGAAEPESFFLRGNYAPVTEEVTAENLKVVGTLPKDLDGLFVRNGPNPRWTPKGKYHWFDGDGMLHGVRLRGGKADYLNRYVRTEGFVEEEKAGKALHTGLLEPPDFKKLLSGDYRKLFKNAANTSLVWHAKKLLALWEGGDPYEMTVPDLKTVGAHTFGGKLTHPWAAHPRIDPDSGEMVGFGYSPLKPHLVFSVVDKDGKLVRTVPLPDARPAMVHDFALTARYAVFVECPMLFKLDRMLKGEGFADFEKDRPTRIALAPRDGKEKARWFDVPAGFVFHVLNAWEDGDAVEILACRFDEFPGGLDGKGPDPESKNVPRLTRWTLDVKAGKAKEARFDEVPSEFPRFNDSRTGRPTRFGYLARVAGDAITGYRKADLAKGTAEVHELGKGVTGGEAIFVPRPDPKREDDGYLLALVHDLTAGRGELLVLDAADVAGKAVAQVVLPKRVPYGFHAAWVPAGEFPRG